MDSNSLGRRLSWLGFISALVALAAYTGAAVSGISRFTETFRIEDRAGDLTGIVSGIDLFEHFRPPHPSFFLNGIGTALWVIASLAAIIATALFVRYRRAPWPIAITIAIPVGLFLAATAAIPTMGNIGLVSLAGLSYLDTYHARLLPSPATATPVQLTPPLPPLPEGIWPRAGAVLPVATSCSKGRAPTAPYTPSSPPG